MKLTVATVLVCLILLLPSLAGAQSSDANQWGAIFEGSNVTHAYNDTPTEVAGLSGVTTLQAGNSDSYAIADGKVWAWGYGAKGELGDAHTADSFNSPVEVTFPSRTDIVAIGEAYSDGFAVDSDGHGWSWGLNLHGSLCLGSDEEHNTPRKVTRLPTTVTAVAGGASHVLWLGSNGEVYACGRQQYGQLGIGNTKDEEIPVRVKDLPADDPVVAISAGDFFSAALTRSGKLYMWGENDYGQLGIGTMTKEQTLPERVPGMFSQVYCGGGSGNNSGSTVNGTISGHTLANTSAGVVEAWGNNVAGQLGNDQTQNEDTPVAVHVPNGVSFIKVIAAGVSSAAIDSNGNVWTWGSDKVGQLGNGTTGGESLLPVEVDSGRSLLSGTANDLIDG